MLSLEPSLLFYISVNAMSCHKSCGVYSPLLPNADCNDKNKYCVSHRFPSLQQNTGLRHDPWGWRWRSPDPTEEVRGSVGAGVQQHSGGGSPPFSPLSPPEDVCFMMYIYIRWYIICGIYYISTHTGLWAPLHRQAKGTLSSAHPYQESQHCPIRIFLVAHT